MSDPSESRAEELEQLLHDQPGSRLFVQLAEEYRRLERYDDAVRTLEKGLEDQPTYVSARVLLGRCRLESGEPSKAIPELEQVLKQDQTHLMAHKLLAEAHLETNDVEAARKQLDLYEMLNESDPEIEELRARLPGAGAAASSEAESPSPATAPETTETESTDDDLFDLGSPPPAATPEDDLLGVWEPSAEPEAQATAEGTEEGGEVEDESPAGAGDDPFGDLWTSDDRQRLNHGFVEEGLFADSVEEPPVSETSPTVQPEERPTVTLGRLYLQQGHHDEARRIFREVLDRDPSHREARAELLRLEPVAAPDVDAPPAPEPGVALPESDEEPESAPEPGTAMGDPEEESEEAEEDVAAAPEPLTAADLEEPGAQGLGLTERKVRMLDNYLRRVRRAAERHVR